MGNINGLQWALYYAEKRKQQEQKKKLTREFAETQIEWQLPEIFCTKKIRTTWYVNDERLIGYGLSRAFIYILRAVENSEVRYVGQTTDPARRYMEHRLDDKLGAPFKMIVVDVGDAETERAWIARCTSEGCELLNLILTK